MHSTRGFDCAAALRHSGTKHTENQAGCIWAALFDLPAAVKLPAGQPPRVCEVRPESVARAADKLMTAPVHIAAGSQLRCGLVTGAFVADCLCDRASGRSRILGLRGGVWARRAAPAVSSAPVAGIAGVVSSSEICHSRSLHPNCI